MIFLKLHSQRTPASFQQAQVLMMMVKAMKSQWRKRSIRYLSSGLSELRSLGFIE